MVTEVRDTERKDGALGDVAEIMRGAGDMIDPSVDVARQAEEGVAHCLREGEVTRDQFIRREKVIHELRVGCEAGVAFPPGV